MNEEYGEVKCVVVLFRKLRNFLQVLASGGLWESFCHQFTLKIYLSYKKRKRSEKAYSLFLSLIIFESPTQDSIFNGVPLEDFGGGHPDPNLT